MAHKDDATVAIDLHEMLLKCVHTSDTTHNRRQPSIHVRPSPWGADRSDRGRGVWGVWPLEVRHAGPVAPWAPQGVGETSSKVDV